MALAQYWYVIRRYWAKLVLVVILIPASVFVFSSLLLFAAPKYSSSVDVTLLPSTGELSFTKNFFGGTRERQANAFVKTAKEYIKSRPVIERALEVVSIKATEEPSAGINDGYLDGYLEGVFSVYDQVSSFLKRIYNTINSGKFVALDPSTALIEKFQRATDIKSVEGSFILRIEVTLSDPDMAAAFANALAAAYVDLSSEQAAVAARDIKAKLAEQIGMRQEILENLVEEEFELRRQLGALSLEDERMSLIKTLESERLVLTSDIVEREQLEIRLVYFERTRTTERQRDVLHNIDEEISLINARREELSRRIEVRSQITRDLRKSIDELAEKERPFLKFQRKRALIEREIENLSEPIASLELASSQEAGKVRVINAARPPIYPNSPKVIRNTMLAAIAGVLIAGMGVVLIDAASHAVRTMTDLRRIAGERALAVLPGKLVNKLARSDWKLRESDWRELASLGSELEQRLAILGDLDSKVIVVTGFGRDALISGTALTIGTAIALRGIKVSCGLPGVEDRADPPEDRINGNLSLLKAGTRASTNAQVHFRCVDPVSADFKWITVTRQCDSLICVVPAGQLPEETLQQFCSEASRNGVQKVSLVVVETSSPSLVRAG
jgi:uncharacterized protein involved in exopolysaccharide biosynthesis